MTVELYTPSGILQLAQAVSLEGAWTAHVFTLDGSHSEFMNLLYVGQHDDVPIMCP